MRGICAFIVQKHNNIGKKTKYTWHKPKYLQLRSQKVVFLVFI